MFKDHSYIYGIPRQNYLKLPCKKCKLRTEHLKVTLRGGETRYVCLRCRAFRTEAEVSHDFTLDELQELPTDDKAPAGVA